MDISSANVRIVGISPYSQSRKHTEPMYEGENKDDHDIRTWRHKMNLSDDGAMVVIPAHGMHQCLAAAAKYSKKQIPGQGKATWTKKFESGITFLEDVPTSIDPNDVQSVTISANANGIRGAGARVSRRFPIMPEWSAEFEVIILDPIITEAVLREMLQIAGMFIGLGRFRPERGGTNGRFRLDKLVWNDRRQLVA